MTAAKNAPLRRLRVNRTPSMTNNLELIEDPLVRGKGSVVIGVAGDYIRWPASASDGQRWPEDGDQ